MAQYIDKAAVMAEIERRIKFFTEQSGNSNSDIVIALFGLKSFLDTLEAKEIVNEKTKWSPSKKQMESLKDMLKYNIGVFDYQKFMEVNSLYDDLTKILDYETDRQK